MGQKGSAAGDRSLRLSLLALLAGLRLRESHPVAAAVRHDRHPQVASLGGGAPLGCTFFFPKAAALHSTQ
eukprot:5534781-Prymnesium_polylepis.1